MCKYVINIKVRLNVNIDEIEGFKFYFLNNGCNNFLIVGLFN